LGGFGDPASHGCCGVGFVADDGAVAVEFGVERGDPPTDLLPSAFLFGVGLGTVKPQRVRAMLPTGRVYLGLQSPLRHQKKLRWTLGVLLAGCSASSGNSGGGDTLGT
jgi:hypothetical protein